MNIIQESVSDFRVGHGGADAAGKPIVAPGYVRKAYKGVRVRAATTNTIIIYVGTQNVTEEKGYPLPAGEELLVPVEDPSKIFVAAASDELDNCQQTVSLDGQISGDTFTLTFRGATTEPITIPAGQADVQAALEALSTIGSGNCSVADTGGDEPYTVTFTGALAKQDVDLMTGVGSGVNEKQTVAITAPVAGDMLTLAFDGAPADEVAYDADAAAVEAALQTIPALAGNVDVTPGDPSGWVVEFVGGLAKTPVPSLAGTCGKNEKQTISIPDSVDTGTFTLTYGTETDAIPFNAACETVQERLEAKTGAGNVAVSGGPGPNNDWIVEFTGTLARQDIETLGATSSCGQNEQQSATVTGASGGTFTLSYDGSDPVSFDYDEEVADFQTKIETIPALTGNVSVSGVVGAWIVEFINALGLGDGAVLLVGNGSGLSGGDPDLTIEQLVDGVTATVSVSETVAGHDATVDVEETQPGDAACSVAVEKANDITADSRYSWLAC